MERCVRGSRPVAKSCRGTTLFARGMRDRMVAGVNWCGGESSRFSPPQESSRFSSPHVTRV